jgi:hypothetical protein
MRRAGRDPPVPAGLLTEGKIATSINDRSEGIIVSFFIISRRNGKIFGLIIFLREMRTLRITRLLEYSLSVPGDLLLGPP